MEYKKVFMLWWLILGGCSTVGKQNAVPFNQALATYTSAYSNVVDIYSTSCLSAISRYVTDYETVIGSPSKCSHVSFDVPADYPHSFYDIDCSNHNHVHTHAVPCSVLDCVLSTDGACYPTISAYKPVIIHGIVVNILGCLFSCFA